MPFEARVYTVLIASPGDTNDARDAVHRALTRWNTLHAQTTNMLLYPVRFETHTYPSLHGTPQQVINQQTGICDLVISVIWTRGGSPTAEYMSGTDEEIERHRLAKSSAMVYFLEEPINPSNVQANQLEAAIRFKNKYVNLGLIDIVPSIQKLEERVFDHVTRYCNDVLQDIPGRSQRSSPRQSAGGHTASGNVVNRQIDSGVSRLALWSSKAKDGKFVLSWDPDGNWLLGAGEHIEKGDDHRSLTYWKSVINEMYRRKYCRVGGDASTTIGTLTINGYALADSANQHPASASDSQSM